ncbi:unnamed protein product, partial [Phaeothamnion confervicola]
LLHSLFVAVIATAFLDAASASLGDRNSWFLECSATCRAKRCGAGAPILAKRLSSRLMGWSCPEDCLFECMSRHDARRTKEGRPHHKYFGRWCFARLLGAQEFFSTVFSVANGLPHLHRLLLSREGPCPRGHFMAPWLTAYAVFGVNTWLWSAVFHARDTRLTEACDYFFALWMLVYTLWVAVLR